MIVCTDLQWYAINLFKDVLVYALFSRTLLCGPTHAFAVYASLILTLACAPTNGGLQLVHCPLRLPCKKVLELSHSYAQDKV